jgi:bifunctional non-homologous end joining protein LigD
MSLQQYHKKRKFSKTPEPKGSLKKNSGPLTFVIQKHEASRLHYDFRLELDGVLKSWAVPKGPSLNPEDRRLAMMVEDHPMDYAGFEGIIPKGNYGAGTVMVWDNGVYTPYDSESSDEIDREKAEKILKAQLKKGHLTFIMLGKKLKGEFALIKTHGAEENAWLLIKKGDEYASTKDITQEDKSVVSNRSMTEIENQAEHKKQIWFSKPKELDLDNAPKAKMPHNIKPMLAHTTDKAFNREGWLFEMKWDGYRTVAEIESGKVTLYSRNLLPYTQRFAPVAEALKKFPGNAVLDGEVVVVDKNGHPNFGWLQDYPDSKKGELIYYVFDMLYFDGHNLEKLPLRERKELLKKILPPLPHIAYSDHIEMVGAEVYEQAEKLGIEGIMAKNGESSYIRGARTHEWLKIKTHKRQEAIICGFTAGRGGRKHFGALVLGVYKNGKLEYIGHTGGGFNDTLLESTLKKLKPLIQDECPFEKKPKTNAPVTWVEPKLLAEIRFASWTNDNIMRQPIFVGLREDKDSTEVVKEEVEPEHHTLKLKNLSKVFWPKEKYTKGDVIEYYKEVAPVLLPYLKDRPESLLRYPNGITGQHFFQKNTSDLLADWIQKVKITSESEQRTIEYLLCQNLESLLYIVNLGCIDLHPWNSRIENLENPDYAIIDLDPEEIGVETVVTVALKVREFLEKLDIESFPKTSGAKGIHIYIPLGAQYDYEQTRHFVELLCIQIHHKIPEISSVERSPQKRKGKVYLDFLQNRHGQTLASVYSVRPYPGAHVSTPLKWSEVTKSLHPSQFTIKNTRERLDKHGDLFKEVLGKGIDMEKILKKLDELIFK